VRITYKARWANFRWEAPNDYLKSALDFGLAGWQPHLVTWICRSQTFFFVPRATERRLEWHRGCFNIVLGRRCRVFRVGRWCLARELGECASGGWAVGQFSLARWAVPLYRGVSRPRIRAESVLCDFVYQSAITKQRCEQALTLDSGQLCLGR